MNGLAQYKLTAVITATPASAGSAGQRIMAVALEAGAGACSVDIHNAASDVASSEIITMNVGAALSQFFDFTNLGGILCDTGIWVVPTGTGAICYVWVG
jgi:hypothetical protein